MSIRAEREAFEAAWLSPHAALSTGEAAKRDAPISPDDFRTDFQRDRDRILHSKAFRRLKHKTQCFVAPEGDHFRTRLTHTLEVAQIARTVARALKLHEDLTEAIALGHDLGHTPFGHMGERILNKLVPGGFAHREQSLRVVDVLERDGQGLNLTCAVRDGILNHSGKVAPQTLEGQCVVIADRIAYINHDIDDAIRAGVLSEHDLPKKAIAMLGSTHGDRINAMIRDIVRESADGTSIRMSDAAWEATNTLRAFLMKEVYMRPSVLEIEARQARLISLLYELLLDAPDELPDDYRARAKTEGRERAVSDFVACMTDRYATRMFEKYFLPKGTV